MMKKIKRWAAGELVFVLCLMVLAGCGSKSYEADRNTVFILKKGQVVSTDVGALPSKEYDEKEFKKYVEKAVAAYTKKNGEGTVEVKSLAVKDDVAKLTMEYASAEDYTKFTGVELFSGTISEALAEGYDFNVKFVNAGTGKKADLKEIMDQDRLQVTVIKGNVDLNLYDDITYYSADGHTLADKQTLSVGKQSAGEGTEAVSSTGSTEDGSIRIVTYDSEQAGGTEEVVTEPTEGGEGKESISDDEMLTGTEENGKNFKFDRPEDTGGKRTQSGSSIFSDHYTYVIY